MSAAVRRLAESLALSPGEAPRLVGLLAQSLATGLFNALFLSAALALFLEQFEIGILPYAYIASSLVGYAAVGLFSALGRRLPFAALAVLALVVVLALAAGLWLASLAVESPWTAFLMVVSIAPCLTLLDLAFWGMATRLFDLRQGKRLFGLVGAGEVVAAILGFFLVPLLLRFLGGPVHLLPIAAGGLVLAVAVVAALGRAHRGALAAARQGAAAGRREGAGRSFAALLKDRYFVLVSLLLSLFVAAIYTVEFGFLGQVPRYFDGSAEAAAFFGVFFGASKVGELLMKTVLAGRLVSQFGLRIGLLALPGALLLAVLAAVLAGALLGRADTLFFVLVALGMMAWVVLGRSMFDPAYRMLYQPLSAAEQLTYQSRIEGTVKQAAILLVGSALALAAARGLGTLPLLAALLPFLAGWVVVVELLHREYRSRLLGALAAAPAAAAAAPAAPGDDLDLLPLLGRVPPRDLPQAMAVLDQVDPTGALPRLTRMIADEAPAARVAALERAARLRAFELRTEIEAAAGLDPSAEVRAAAAAALAALCQVTDLMADAERLPALAGSERAADRAVAAVALGRLGGVEARKLLAELLWDKDRSVRRAALVAAGRAGHPELWPRLVADLALPGCAGFAGASATLIGEPILPELEVAFGRSSRAPEARLRVLDVVERIGGPRARALLLDALSFPDEAVRQRALTALIRSRYRATPEHAVTLHRKVEQVVESTAWNMAALLDLADEPAAARAAASLSREVDRGRGTLYRLLSVLYDAPSIRLVQEHLESGGGEARAYALEIVDLVVAPELRPMVLPLLEGLPAAQCLRRLEAFARQPRLGARERLGAIAHRDPALMGTWTKACALRALGAVAPPQVGDDLVAALFHPDPLLREVAAGTIHELDPAAYARHVRKLPFEDRERIDRLVAPGDPDRAPGWEGRTRFGRALALGEVEGLAGLPPETLALVAGVAEERRLAPGDRLPASRESLSSLYVVTAGSLDAGERGVRQAGEALAFRAAEPPAVAPGPATVLRLDGEQLLELAAGHPELIPAILFAGRTPVSRRGPGAATP